MYSAGDCPICFDSGALIAVASIASGEIFLYCPLCGTAWDKHPRGKVDAILPLLALAPRGVLLATRSQIDSSGLGPFNQIDDRESEGWWRRSPELGGKPERDV